MSLFSRYIQPPAYLKLPIFALDISDRSFKYIKFKETPRGQHIDDYGSEPLPDGLVASGIITDTASLAAVLKKHFEKKPIRHVALSLPEEKGFVRTIRMPRVPVEEMREAISLQLEDYVPLPPDETSFAYHALPARNANTMDVLLAAYPTTLLQSYKKTADEAGLTVASLEIESQAIARSVIPADEEKNGILVVDIGLTRTSFMFAQYGYTQLTSTIPIGGASMHSALSKQLHISEKEAERLKIEYGLLNSKDSKQVFTALVPLVDSIKTEIERRVAYWQAETSAKELSHIYLCGREANLIGLPNLLTTQLGVPATLANVWTNIITDPAYVPEIEFRESLGFATSVGLALGVQQT
jgi:type IV pilus assembly protein PilM